MMKRSIKLNIALVIALSILTLLTSQWPWVFAQSQEINLIDNKHNWKPFRDTIISQNESGLEILVVTNHTGKIYSRAFLPTQINSAMNKSLILTLDYASQSNKGNATFLAEIRANTSKVTDNSSSKVLWNSALNNTNGQLSNETFTIPSKITNRPVEIRLNVITEGKGEHTLTIKKANIVHSS